MSSNPYAYSFLEEDSIISKDYESATILDLLS